MSQFAHNNFHGLFVGKARDIVLELTQFFDVRQRQQIGAGGDRLPDFDEGRAEPEQLTMQPFGLPLQMFFLAFVFFADEPAAMIDVNEKMIEREGVNDMQRTQISGNAMTTDDIVGIVLRGWFAGRDDDLRWFTDRN